MYMFFFITENMEIDEKLKWLEARIVSSLRPRNEDLKNMFANEENRSVCSTGVRPVLCLLLFPYNPGVLLLNLLCDCQLYDVSTAK